MEPSLSPNSAVIGKRMLLVEDEESLRDLLAEEFSEHGFEVVTAKSGDLASHYLRDGDFDILVTDINTPGSLTGLDLVWRARAFSIRLPAIILTGRPELVTRRLSDSEVLIGKPFVLQSLLSAVERLLH